MDEKREKIVRGMKRRRFFFFNEETTLIVAISISQLLIYRECYDEFYLSRWETEKGKNEKGSHVT